MKSQKKNYSRKNKNTKRHIRRNARSKTRKMRGGTRKQYLELTTLLLNKDIDTFSINNNILTDKMKFMLYAVLSFGYDNDKLDKQIAHINPGLEIKKNTHLKNLNIDLISNPDDVENLMDALSLNQTLDTLTINYVTIDKEYAEFIASSLIVNKSLKILNLINGVEINNEATDILKHINSPCKIMIKNESGRNIRINYDKHSNANNLEHRTKYYEAPHYDRGAANNNNVTSKIAQRLLAKFSN